MRTSLLPGAAIGIALVFATIGCSSAPVLSDTNKPTQIRIGIRKNVPGVGLIVNGDPSGFDVDVAAYVAWKMGYSPFEIEWVALTGANREEALINDRVDMVVAAYAISDERREVVDFAGPYFMGGQDLLVRSDETRIAGTESLAGMTICTVAGTVSLTRIEAIVGDSAKIVTKEYYTDCMPGLVSGEIDAVTTDGLMLAGLAAMDVYFGYVRLVGNPFSTEQYGIGLPHGSYELCKEVNQALLQMIDDGTWAVFIERHTAGTGYVVNAEVNPPEPAECR